MERRVYILGRGGQQPPSPKNKTLSPSQGAPHLTGSPPHLRGTPLPSEGPSRPPISSPRPRSRLPAAGGPCPAGSLPPRLRCTRSPLPQRRRRRRRRWASAAWPGSRRRRPPPPPPRTAPRTTGTTWRGARNDEGRAAASVRSGAGSGASRRRRRRPREMLRAPSPRTPPPRPASGSRPPAGYLRGDWLRAGAGERAMLLLAKRHARLHSPPLRLVGGHARHPAARSAVPPSPPPARCAL